MSDTKIGPWPSPPRENEVRGLLERARGGDPTELAALRQALDGHPEIWRAYGDLAAHARVAWIGLIGGTDFALKESLGRQVGAMKDELSGPDPSPLEALLIERIVACWLQVCHADAAATEVGDLSLMQANHARKRQDSAHRRYLTAVGALAMTRRLQAPAAGASGVTAKSSMASTSPAGVVEGEPGTDELAGHATHMAGSSQANDSDVLELSPPGVDGHGGGRRGPRRRPTRPSRT